MIAFIDHILPEFPVINRKYLQQMYESFNNGTVISPLLFHSILSAASQYVDEAVLKTAGFESRSASKEYFYRRATLLYSMDCEREQLLALQSLLFLCPWWYDFGEEKDTRHWLYCACKLLHDMGMHKAVSKSSRLSTEERSIWRRIFWMVFVSKSLYPVPPRPSIPVDSNEQA
jgi:hypothetical protein